MVKSYLVTKALAESMHRRAVDLVSSTAFCVHRIAPGACMLLDQLNETVESRVFEVIGRGL